MSLTFETFHIGLEQAGVLFRRIGEDVWLDLIVFVLPDGGLYHVEQETQVGAGPLEWRGFTSFDPQTGARVIGEVYGDIAVVDGTEVSREAIPSFMAHRVLLDLIANGGDRVEFRQFSEAEPVVQGAEFVRRGPEQIPTPAGEISADRFDLVVDGSPYTSFWSDGASVVASDWSGANSYLVADLDAALRDAPTVVADVAREWVANITN